jgi:Ni,Fe-hydrogenase III small subunit
MVVKMAHEGKRHKIDTCYFHHEKEDIPTRNTEKHSDPITEIGQISGCSPKPQTIVEGTYVYAGKETTSQQI